VLFSYAGQLCWGFTAEWDLVPDLDDFVADIEVSFRELRDAPTQREKRPPLAAGAKQRARRASSRVSPRRAGKVAASGG
jgi:hypothetical protein